MESKISRNIPLLIAAGGLLELRFYTPFAIIYFSKVAGSYTLGMMVFTISTFATFASEIPTGIVSDIMGRRLTAIVGAVACLISSICYAIAPSFLLLAIGSLFDGFSKALHSGNDDALLYDSLSDLKQIDEYGTIISRSISVFQLCGAICAIVGGVVGEWSLRALLWISVIPVVIRVILFFKVKNPAAHRVKNRSSFQHLVISLKNGLFSKKIRSILIGSSIVYGLEESCWYFRAAFIQTIWPLYGVGFARVLAKISGAVGSSYTGKMVKKIDAMKILIGSFFVGRALNFIALLIPNITSPVWLGMSNAAYSGNLVTKRILLQKEFSKTERATMGSIESLIGSFIFMICSSLAGVLADQYGPAVAIGVLQGALFSSLFFFSSYERCVKLENDSEELLNGYEKMVGGEHAV